MITEQELDNAIEQAVRVSMRVGLPLTDVLTRVRRTWIIETLNSAKKMGVAAEMLGMHRNTLIRYRKQLDIPKPAKRRIVA